MIAQASVEHLPLASESVDLIFTDPIYKPEHLHKYQWLARESMRVLKAGGFVLAMCGGHKINRVFKWFDDSGLTFHWKHEVSLPGSGTGMVWHRGIGHRTTIVIRLKSVLAYSKGESGTRSSLIDKVPGLGPDKRFHEWGQDVESARYLIDCYSLPGALVLDPFVGGGTTPAACKIIGRRCISFDIDPRALCTTARRLK